MAARSIAWLVTAVALAACSLEQEGVLESVPDAGAEPDAAAGAGGWGGQDAGSDSQPDAPSDSQLQAEADAQPPSCSVFSPNVVSLVIQGELHCYWRSATAATFTEAVQACSGQNAQLASVLSLAENDAIRSITEPPAVSEVVWLGATDGKAESESGVGVWSWLSGEPFGFSPWAPDSGGEPDGACDSCATGWCCHHMLALRLSDGLWFDRWQGNLYAYVCEAVAGPI